MLNKIMEDALQYNRVRGFVEGTIVGGILLYASVALYKKHKNKE